jgi:hypothetical protein
MSAPLVVDADAATIDAHLDRAAHWLTTTAALQSAYQNRLHATVELIDEPRIRAWLTELDQAAHRHEEVVDQLYGTFDRTRPTPGSLRTVGGTAIGLARGVLGHVQGFAAGASARVWRNLRITLLANLDAISGFGVAEQLGLALGRPAAVDLARPVVAEKTAHQLLLREVFLELAPDVLLYRRGM